MQLEHEFVVPVPVAQAWDVLLDVERIAPCMPGATVVSFDGENVEGRVKVKVGPIQVTYAGTAKFTEKDEANRRVTIDAKGKEARGSGTAAATIKAQLLDDGGSSTKVTVTTDLAITGKPAQFGRGVMVEVGNKLLGRFADCLHEEIENGSVGGASEAGTPAADAAPSAEAAPAADGGAAPAAGVAAEASSAGAPAAEPAPSDAGLATADEPTASSAGSQTSDAAAKVAAATASPIPQASPAPPPRPAVRRPAENEAIDLLDAAGPAVLKRALPLVGGLVLLFLLWRLARRR